MSRKWLLPLLLSSLIACTHESGLHHIQKPVQISAGDSLDILLILDTSCSMQDDYSTVYYGLGMTADEIDRIDADWRLGVISADPDAPDLYEVDPNSNSPGWDLMIAIDEVSSQYDAQEVGFAAANEKQWFLRENVPTFVIFVSDEEEQSNISSDEFVEQWPNDLYVASIVGPYSPTDLAYSDDGYCSADAAPKYHQAANFYVNICSEEPWSIIEEYNDSE